MHRIGESRVSLFGAEPNNYDFDELPRPTYQPAASAKSKIPAIVTVVSQHSWNSLGPQSGVDERDADSTQNHTHTAYGSDITWDGSQAPPGTSKAVEWRIHWAAPTLMLGLLFMGIALALGHHFFYQYLDGTVVDSVMPQEWATRFGSAFAWLIQSSLAASVGVAYTQRVWVSARKRPLPLATLDNLFSLQTNIFSFLNWEILAKAKVVCLVGLCIWCIPISSLITPATLSVTPGVVTNITSANVSCPDYSLDMFENWVTTEGVGRPNGATPEVTRLLTATLTSMEILPVAAPYPNSSYSMQFYGPAFRCQNMSTAVINNTFDTGSAATLQTAWDRTMNESNLGYQSGRFPLYIGASPDELQNVYMPSELFVSTHGFGEDDFVFTDARNYSCHFWNMSYTVNFEFQDGVQSTKIEKLEPLAPLNITFSGGDIYFEYGTAEMQYVAMFDVLADALSTQVGEGDVELYGMDSDILRSGLGGCPEIKGGWESLGAPQPWSQSLFCRAGSIPAAIEDLSHNLTLSILSSALLANETAANITVNTWTTFYSYNWRNLVLAYAVAISATAVCVGVGLQALVKNGYSANISFSTILLTTRNPDLDRLSRGHCLGESPLGNDIGERRLQFGILQSRTYKETSSGAHAGFGFVGDVREIQKGEPCW